MFSATDAADRICAKFSFTVYACLKATISTTFDIMIRIYNFFLSRIMVLVLYTYFCIVVFYRFTIKLMNITISKFCFDLSLS